MKSNMQRQLQPIKDIQLSERSSCLEIVEMMMESGGFVGRHLAEGVDILVEMHEKDDCTNFLSTPAAPVATGLRGVIAELVRRKIFDVVIAASGLLDHDVARCSADYYKGDFGLDDADLTLKKIHRLGNLLVPRSSYGSLLEEKMTSFLQVLYDRGFRKVASSTLCKELGLFLNNNRSILSWCARNNIPVILPGPLDGAVGSQTWFFSQTHHDFYVDIMGDQEILSKIVFDSKRSGALMVGGGITKHHTLWWNQFRGGLDYAVYITTASEYDGSLSGALIKEAISWGKIKRTARQVTVHADATAVLPFMVTAFLQRIEGKRKESSSR